MASYRHREDENSGGDGRRSFRPPPRSDYHHRGPHNSQPSSSSARPYRGGSSPHRYDHPPHDRASTPPQQPSRGPAGRNDARSWDERQNDGAGDTQDGRGYHRGRSPPPQQRRSGHGSGYRDRDREGYKSPEYGSRSRSRSGSRSRRRSRSPYYGGHPSKEVMMDEMPVDMIEEDVVRELKRYCKTEELEDVRIIRDRQTKASRGFGFLRFASLESSRAFVEQNYPTVYFEGTNKANGDQQVAKVRIAYSRERDEKNRAERGEVEWKCQICNFSNFPGRKVCFKCHTAYDVAFSNPQPVSYSQFTNSGDSDASPNGAPSQFLLIRGLEPSVSEELLAKGVQKMYKPLAATVAANLPVGKKGAAKVASTTGDANLGAKEGTLRRVLLVRDRNSNESWRYGFAEFSSVDDAQAALTRYQSFERFTISSKQINASFVHAGVFVPVFDATHTDERFTFTSSANASVQLQYWDESAFASELPISTTTNRETLPGTASAAAAKSAADIAAAAAEKEGIMTRSEDADVKSKKRKADMKDVAKPKKALPAHLQFWSNRHAELHGIHQQNSLPNQPPASDETYKDATPSRAEVNYKKPPTLSFADPKKTCCYLCSRQFKSGAEVNKHERLSQLHRDNLLHEDLVSKALIRLRKAGIATPRVLQEEDGNSTNISGYRDRAKERRTAFGDSAKTSLPLKKHAQNLSSSSEVAAATKKEADGGSSPSPAAQSKGASLLGKMGWAAGEGLGARGTGMTTPIATEMYVAGVGLGAQGGKMGDAAEEAGRATKDNSYGDFVERAKEKAKERFERMA